MEGQKEGVPREERRGSSEFQTKQDRIRELEGKREGGVSLQERNELRRLRKERTKLGQEARAKGLFFHADKKLAEIFDAADGKEDKATFVFEQLEQSSRIEEGTYKLPLFTRTGRELQSRYGGLIKHYTERALNRMWVEFAEKDIAGNPDFQEMREYLNRAKKDFTAEEWEWKVPERRNGTSEEQKGESRARPSVEEEILEEIKKMREAAEETANASKRSAESTTQGTRERVLKELDNHVLGATGWIREKLGVLESRVVPFSSHENLQLISELNSILDSLSEHPKREYEARRSLHDYFLVFRGSPNVEAARNAAGEIRMTNFRTLFRIPGVAGVFRELERRAKVERGIYESIQRGDRKEKINPEEKLVTATGDELDAVRKGVTEAIKPTVEQSLPAQGRDREAVNTAASFYADSARRIGERLWHITGRSSYWNALTYAGEPKPKPKPGQKPEDFEDFKAISGRGEMGGAFFLTSIFNLREFLKIGKKRGGFLDYWFEKEGLGHELQKRIFNLGVSDLWSTVLGKYVKDGLKEREERELEALKLPLGLVSALKKENGNFISSLDSLPFEDIEFAALLEGQYAIYLSGLTNAEKVKEAFSDSAGFLSNPTPDNFAKVAPLFKHLEEEQQDEIKKALLTGMLDLNRRRILGRSLAETRYSKGIRGWDEKKAEEEFRKLVELGVVKTRTANEVLSRFYGPRGWRVTKQGGGEFVKNASLSFLDTLLNMLKGSLK